MGDSDKLVDSRSDSYRFVEHRRHLDAFFNAVDVREHVTLVLHDWGSALGFDWARRHPSAVRGIAYMEAFVATISSWGEWPAQAVAPSRRSGPPQARRWSSTATSSSRRSCPPRSCGLSGPEMAVYRRPYREPGESRRPTLTWPRQMRVAGEPRDVHDIITRYAERLGGSTVAKLFIEARPGAMFETHRLRQRSPA